MFQSTKVVSACVVLLTLFTACRAQQAQNQPTLSILVNVLDRQANAIRDLAKEDFRIQVNGPETAVRNAQDNSGPRRLVVLIDVSGSVGPSKEKNTKWQITQQAVRELLEQAPADQPIAMIAFAGKTTDTITFSQGRPAIRSWLQAASSANTFYASSAESVGSLGFGESS